MEQTRLVSGRLVDLSDIKAEDINAYDIAWALSQINRYNGHSIVPVSVLSHTGLCYYLAMSEAHAQRRQIKPCDALGILLHDAGEAYVGERVWPLDETDLGKPLHELENKILSTILARFASQDIVDQIDWNLVRRYDEQAVHVEYYTIHPELRSSKHMLTAAYPMSQYPPLMVAKPTDYIDLLRSIAIQVNTPEINGLFAVPETLVAYLNAQKVSQQPIEGSEELPPEPDLSDVERMT